MNQVNHTLTPSYNIDNFAEQGYVLFICKSSHRHTHIDVFVGGGSFLFCKKHLIIHYRYSQRDTSVNLISVCVCVCLHFKR